jgi:hypothetical protein
MGNGWIMMVVFGGTLVVWRGRWMDVVQDWCTLKYLLCVLGASVWSSKVAERGYGKWGSMGLAEVYSVAFVETVVHILLVIDAM